MGSSYSTQDEKTDTTTKVENVKRLFDIDENDDFLETLNISDLKINDNKLPLPIIGGTNDVKDDLDNFNDLNDIDFNLVGGGQSNDIRFMPKRRRYLKHNIFKILSQLDANANTNINNKLQKGGNGNEDEKYLSTSSDDEAIKNIKEIILREVNKLNTNSSAQSGGGCGCDSKKEEQDDQEDQEDQDGGAKKRRAKKTSKKSKKQKGGDRRRGRKQAPKNVTSSDSSSSSSSSSSSDDSEGSYKSNIKSSLNQSESSLKTESEEETDDSSEESESESEESQKGGLSIFPFNSSEVKSTVSEKKNMRMIRRKI